MVERESCEKMERYWCVDEIEEVGFPVAVLVDERGGMCSHGDATLLLHLQLVQVQPLLVQRYRAWRGGAS
jgi:hypothetical protein